VTPGTKFRISNLEFRIIYCKGPLALGFRPYATTFAAALKGRSLCRPACAALVFCRFPSRIAPWLERFMKQNRTPVKGRKLDAEERGQEILPSCLPGTGCRTLADSEALIPDIPFRSARQPVPGKHDQREALAPAARQKLPHADQDRMGGVFARL